MKNKIRLSQMKSEQGMEFVSKIMPFVFEMAKDSEVQNAYHVAVSEKKTISDLMFECIGILLKKPSALYEILAIQEGKTANEIADQPFGVTMEQTRFLFDKSFIGFFMHALSMTPKK